MIIKKARNHKTNNTLGTLIDYIEVKSIVDYAEHKTNKTWYINLPSEKDLSIKVIKATQEKNTRSKAPKTYHYIVSFRDGEKPSDEILKSIEQKISGKLGYTDHQRVLAVHDDTAHYHMHVVINTIHPLKATNVTPFNDFLIMDEVAKEIEQEFNLQIDNRIDKSKRYTNNKAKDFEAHTGFQSLETYIKEKLYQSIQDLIIDKDKNNWQNLHSLLDKYNFTIQEKTNGLIFQDKQTKIQVKASSISRNFSKSKLEQKLGLFIKKENNTLEKSPLNPQYANKSFIDEQIYNQVKDNAVQTIIEPQKKSQKQEIINKYEKQPIHKNADNLWEKYQKSESEKLSQQNNQLKIAKQIYAKDLEQIKQLKNQQKQHLKSSGINYKNRLSININIENNAKQAYEKAFTNYKAAKQEIYTSTKKLNWTDYLMQEAKNNPLAVKILQSNLKKQHIHSIKDKENNKIQSMEFLRQNNKYMGYGKIAKNGEIHYITTDNGYFKASKDGIYLIKDSPLARKQALEIAEKSYGKNLNIQGTQNFVQEMSQQAKEKNLNISNGLSHDR